MRRIAAGLVVVLMSLLGFVSLATPANADTIDSSAEAQFVTLINALRASKGLGTLTVDGNLTDVARQWSQQMANAGTISHNPNFPNQVTSDWQMLGENVGQGYSVQSLFDAFVASPHHYENLVEPSYTRVGVGVVVTPSGQIFTSHEFMALRSGGGSRPGPEAPDAEGDHAQAGCDASVTTRPSRHRRRTAAATTPTTPPPLPACARTGPAPVLARHATARPAGPLRAGPATARELRPAN